MKKAVNIAKYTQVKLDFKKKTKFLLRRAQDVILKGECKKIILTLPVGEYRLTLFQCGQPRETIRFLLCEDRCEILS